MAVRGFVWIIAYLAEDKLLMAKLLAGYGTSFFFGDGLFANTVQALSSWSSGGGAFVLAARRVAGAEVELQLEQLRGACEAAFARLPCP